MNELKIRQKYFSWLVSKINENNLDYKRLLARLHQIKFYYIISYDENREADGIYLRYRFASHSKLEYRDYLTGPCSVLEMLVALAIKCEENIMDDPEYGDRTSQWFWEMIRNLGLYSMNDNDFDPEYVNNKIKILLNREYDFDGSGSLFPLKNPPADMRNIEIWCQLNWWLNEKYI